MIPVSIVLVVDTYIDRLRVAQLNQGCSYLLLPLRFPLYDLSTLYWKTFPRLSWC
jgi:hypothetical protein